MKRLPSDLLDERRAIGRRLGADAPTVQQLQRHAERYGIECVVETAVELGHSFDSCVRLQDACDRIESARERDRHPRARPQKMKPSEDRVRAFMGLEKSEQDT